MFRSKAQEVVLGIADFRARTLKGKQRFERLFRGGRRIPQRGITLIVEKDETGIGGLAVCISRAKNAVHRNRMRRIAREAINPIVSQIRPGWSVAIFPDSHFLNATLGDRYELARAAFLRADLLESA